MNKSNSKENLSNIFQKEFGERNVINFRWRKLKIGLFGLWVSSFGDFRTIKSVVHFLMLDPTEMQIGRFLVWFPELCSVCKA